jgi:hypothetical protein
VAARPCRTGPVEGSVLTVQMFRPCPPAGCRGHGERVIAPPRPAPPVDVAAAAGQRSGHARRRGSPVKWWIRCAGDRRIRAVPPVGHCAGRMAGFPMSHPYLHAHEFQIPAPIRDFQSARWTVVPAPAGTMCRHAGKIGERRLPDPPQAGRAIPREMAAHPGWRWAHSAMSRRSMAAAIRSGNESGVHANAGTPSAARAAALSWS